MNTPTTTAQLAPAVDPSLARAEFFSELEFAELTMTIPQAGPLVAVAKY